MGRLIEGVWDCSYCGSKKIRGSIRVCPVCGRQRDDSIRFYMDNPKNYVSEDVAKTINRNPDWYCSYCDALNSDSSSECYVCGSSKADSEQNYFEKRAEVDARRSRKETEKRIARESAIGVAQKNKDTIDAIVQHHQDQVEAKPRASVYDGEYKRDLTQKNEYRPRTDDEVSDYPHITKTSSHTTSSSRKSTPWGNIFKIGAGILAAILIILLIGWAVTPQVHEVTIQDFSWERSISIEEYVTVDRDGWSLPSDGRLKYSQQEIKGYTQVIDHYETKTRTYTEEVFDHYEEYVSGYRDLGNGYFEEITSQVPVYRTETRTETYEEPVYRDEPIYATKYYYEIDVWQYAFSYNTSGNDQNPYWKEFTLEDLQREGSRSQTYYITVVNNEGEVDKYHFDYETWKSLNKGDVVTIKTTIFGGAELVVDGEVVQEDTDPSQQDE